jgi:hypothetical protein
MIDLALKKVTICLKGVHSFENAVADLTIHHRSVWAMPHH